MTDRQDFSDEELTAYLDGETEHAPVQRIERALDRDHSLKERLEALSVDKTRLKTGFDALLDAAPDAPTLTAPEHQDAPKSPMAWRSTAATALICLMVGSGAGYMFAPQPDTGWHSFVAAYQALYVNATLSPIERSEPVALAELERVSQALGKDLELAAFQQHDQLDYKRAQVLGFKGRPLVQLAFLSKVGAPIALCIIKADGGSAEIVTSTMQGMHTAAWAKGGYKYLLIGGTDAGLIENAAKHFAAKL